MENQIKVGSKVKVIDPNSPGFGYTYYVSEIEKGRATLEFFTTEGKPFGRHEKLTSLELVKDVEEVKEANPNCFCCCLENVCGAHRAHMKLFNDYSIFKQDGPSNMIQALAKNCEHFKRIKEEEND